MRSPIVVGADGSAKSRLAIAEAGTLAKLWEGSVIVVLVTRPSWLGGFSTLGLNVPGSDGAALERERTILEAEVTIILDPLEVDWHLESRIGDPANELIRSARAHGADAIVIPGRPPRIWENVATALRRWRRSLVVVRPVKRAKGLSDRDSRVKR
jgi:nucleotide-binding universal stress UspA family protein